MPKGKKKKVPVKKHKRKVKKGTTEVREHTREIRQKTPKTIKGKLPKTPKKKSKKYKMGSNPPTIYKKNPEKPKLNKDIQRQLDLYQDAYLKLNEKEFEKWVIREVGALQIRLQSEPKSQFSISQEYYDIATKDLAIKLSDKKGQQITVKQLEEEWLFKTHSETKRKKYYV